MNKMIMPYGAICSKRPPPLGVEPGLNHVSAIHARDGQQVEQGRSQLEEREKRDAAPESLMLGADAQHERHNQQYRAAQVRRGAGKTDETACFPVAQHAVVDPDRSARQADSAEEQKSSGNTTDNNG